MLGSIDHGSIQRSTGQPLGSADAGRNLIYRNDTIGSCRGVGRGEALIIRQTSSQMCAGDIARTADLVAGFETGSCALGPFIPYRRTRP